MERSKFYKDLSIQQIQFADSLTAGDFTRWATKGEQNPILLSRTTFDGWLRAGGHSRALNQIVENAHAQANTGQSYAQFDGFSMIVPGLKTMKVMAPNETVTDLWASTFKRFNARYPQYVDCPQNTELVNQFIRANRDALPEGETVAPSLAAWESFFKICFSRLYLRRVTKVVTEAGGAPAPAGAAQSLKVAPQAGQAYNPLLYADIQRKEKQAAAQKAARDSRSPSPYARPKLESCLVETILAPAEVMNLSADEHALFMQPMSFPGVTDSADEYMKSERFIAETPARQTPAQREQTAAQISREVEVFCNAYPDYVKYAKGGVYDGLSKIVMEKIDSWGLLVTSQSLLDAFSWAVCVGLIPQAVDHADGQVATFHVKPDLNPPPTATSAGSIRYHGKRIRDMSSQDLQVALNESDDFRKLVDSTV